MNHYNWQQPDWPNFRYDISSFHEHLLSISEKMGFISGQVTHLSEDLKTDILIDLMVEEAVKTSEIEGEHISHLDIRSSIKNNLGLNPKNVPIQDTQAKGIAELMLDVRNTFKEKLTEEKLFDWHMMVMSGSISPNLRIGYWRTDKNPMQVVSTINGKWIMHYETPPSHDVPLEMKKFILWFNDTAPRGTKEIKFAPVRAAIAHLYFESIHPSDMN